MSADHQQISNDNEQHCFAMKAAFEFHFNKPFDDPELRKEAEAWAIAWTASHAYHYQTPDYWFAECDDPDYSILTSDKARALSQVSDHGGKVIPLREVEQTQKTYSFSFSKEWFQNMAEREAEMESEGIHGGNVSTGAPFFKFCLWAQNLLIPKAEQGIFKKFIVSRTDANDLPGRKHHGCVYFVLDLSHDKHAYKAIKSYAASCAKEYPVLSKDLFIKAEAMRAAGIVPQHRESELNELRSLARDGFCFVNDGEEPDYSHLDCPSCGGSGHIGDVAGLHDSEEHF